MYQYILYMGPKRTIVLVVSCFSCDSSTTVLYGMVGEHDEIAPIKSSAALRRVNAPCPRLVLPLHLKGTP